MSTPSAFQILPFKFFIALLSCASLAMFTGFWFVQPTMAATQAIMVNPANQSLTIEPGQATLAVAVTLTNQTAQSLELSLRVVDFDSDQQLSGSAVFTGLDATEFTTKHGLSKWMALDQRQINIPAGKSVTVTGNLRNSEDLSPGGHYGAILATQLTPDQTDDIGVQPAISSLLFVTKQGGEVAGVSLNQVQTDQAWWGKVDDTGLQFDNPGNVHVIPRGLVEVTDPLNRIIGKGIINTESAIVLPGQDRTLQVPIQSISLPLFPGTYVLSSHYRYDGSDEVQTKSQAYFSIGLLLPILMLVILILTSGWYLTSRRHNKSHS